MTDLRDQGLGPQLVLDQLVPYVVRLVLATERIANHLERGGQPAEPESTTRRRRAGKVTERRGNARDFIEDMLRLEGDQPWLKIVEKGGFYGHSERTLRRERDHVAVSKRIDGHWVWRLRPNLRDGGANARGAESMGGR